MKKLTLRTVFIIPLAVQIVLTVSAVAYFSWRSGQQDVNAVASLLRQEITARVTQKIEIFLAAPHLINQINADALAHGDLDDIDQESAEYLWQQSQLFPGVAAIQFALPEDGHYMGIVNPGRDEPVRFQFRDETTGEVLHFYTVGHHGRFEELQRIGESVYDPRVRPWYTEAVELGEARWGGVEPAVTVQTLAIDASQPAYDHDGNLLGVLVVDIFLAQIDEFLEEIQVGETGLVFIMERTGLLVADSASEPAFTINPETGEPERILGRESNNDLIRASAIALDDTHATLSDISSGRELSFSLDGETHFLQVTPYVDERGLDWLVIVVVPERDFMGQITANYRNTLFLIIGALLIGLIVGILTVRWLTRPILELNESAKALSAGNWQHEVKTTRQDEIGELAQSFNQMARQLQNSIVSLEERIETQQQIEAALRESEEKYRTLVEAADDGIVLIDMEGNLLLYNHAYLHHLGYSAEELKVMSIPSIIHPDDQHLWNESFKTLLAEGATSVEYRVRHKDGRWAYCLAKQVLITDGENKPESILTITSDITERRALEKQVVQQERLAAVGQLAAGVAHDFNNILSSMMLYVDLLTRLPDLPVKATKYIGTVMKQNRRAAALVQQILDFSRRTPLDKQVVDMVPLLQEIVMLTNQTFPDNIAINLSHTSDTHLVEADATRMHQVIMNLLLNGRDALQDGGELNLSLDQIEVPAIDSVYPSQLSAGRWLCVNVSDNGTGIAEEHLERLFEPFFTTKTVGQGTGLGLAQVYGIIQQHQGMVDVSSQINEGTTFTIYLPLTTDSARLGPIRETSSDVPYGNGELILIVEDDGVTQEALVQSIIALNYQVITADNGHKALAILKEPDHHISLVISDMIMPKMTGAELLQAMRTAEIEIPAIILSGYLPEDDLEELRELGLSTWLNKPPELEVLAATIAKNLARE